VLLGAVFGGDTLVLRVGCKLRLFTETFAIVDAGRPGLDGGWAEPKNKVLAVWFLQGRAEVQGVPW
jgi:hypothetical protein